jgi:hypothetical protein
MPLPSLLASPAADTVPQGRRRTRRCRRVGRSLGSATVGARTASSMVVHTPSTPRPTGRQPRLAFIYQYTDPVASACRYMLGARERHVRHLFRTFHFKCCFARVLRSTWPVHTWSTWRHHTGACAQQAIDPKSQYVYPFLGKVPKSRPHILVQVEWFTTKTHRFWTGGAAPSSNPLSFCCEPSYDMR